MTGYLEQIRQNIEAALRQAVNAVVCAAVPAVASENRAGDADAAPETNLTVQVRPTKYAIHGEFTANVPAVLAKETGRPAAVIARLIMESPALEQDFLQKIAYAEPGFLNFYLVSDWRRSALEQIVTGGVTAAWETAPETLNFEVQYAYSRICSQLRLLVSLGYEAPAAESAHLELLTQKEEQLLMEKLAAAPFEKPEQLPFYLEELSQMFHQFFNTSPIRGESKELAGARLFLVQACKTVMQNAFAALL